MKNKSDRLKIVLDLAARKEQSAMEVLAQKRRYRDEQQSQLTNLKQYHTQYLADIKQDVNHVQNAVSLQANLHFLSQIDAAINQQEGVIHIAEQELSKAMQEWTILHQKRKGMADLIGEYKKQETSLYLFLLTT